MRNEIHILSKEEHPYFASIFQRDGFWAKLFGKNFRYVCYLYEPNKLVATEKVRGYSKTKEQAELEIDKNIGRWLEVWNKEDYWKILKY